MAISSRDQGLMIVLAIVSAIGVPYGIYAYPYQDYVRWGVEIKKKQEELRQAEDAAMRLSKLQEDRRHLQDAFEESKKRLPTGGELRLLDQKISDLLKECGITPGQISSLNLSPEAPVAGRPYNQVPIQLTLKSVEWRNLLTFIGRIEQLDRLIDITSLNISQEGSRYGATMTLETYVLPASEEGG